MASSANVPKATNGAGIEAGDLSPEEAERFASAFRPIWDFDDAPFAAGPAQLSDSDVRELSAGGVSSDVDATLKVGALSASALPDILEAPAPAPRPPPPKPKAPAVEAARAVPQARPAPRPSFRDASSSIELPALRKSNKGLFIGIGAVVLVAGLFFGVRAMTSEPDKAPGVTTTATTATPTAAREESRIPPPPEPAAPTAATTATPTVAPEPTTPAPTAAPPPARADKPEKPEPIAAQPHAAPPPPRPTPHAAPRSSPPPAPAKPKGGSIVRDNPF